MSSDDVPVALSMKQGPLLYAAQGTGVPIVAVHGLPGSTRDFRRLGESLEGVRFIRLNMPGFAGSAPVGGEWEALIATVAEAARTLAEGPFVMLGHSFGGVVALRVAARSKECRGLALLAPGGLRPHRAVRKLPPRLVLSGMKSTRVAREVFYQAMARTPIGAYASREDSDSTLALLSTVDFAPSREAACSLSVPVWCANCSDDPLIEPEIIEELLAALHTQKEHVVFEKGGHAPQRDHAKVIGAALSKFAQTCLSAP